MDLPALRRALLAWYGRAKRDLPWRRSRDPYRVWVSEIMLQQTQVKTVVPYYGRFLARFPTVERLARAPEADVLAAWAGLGYYRRARYLQEGARLVLRDHGGVFPRDPAAKVPGVGRYTMGAIQSIAYGAPLPVLDGNVARVLSRLRAVEGEPKRNEKRLWALAEELLERRSPGDWNQAMMELGATVCLPAAPACPACPVSPFCEARRRGLQDRLPVPAARKREMAVRLRCVVAEEDGRLLVERRRSGLLAGHWGLPEPRPGLRPAEPLGEVRHSITHHRVTLEAARGRWTGGRLPKGLRWAGREEARGLLVSSLWRKALELTRPPGRARAAGR